MSELCASEDITLPAQRSCPEWKLISLGIDWRKSSPGIKSLKSLQVLALSRTPWCVHAQGHNFFGFPFPVSEGNTVMEFPFSSFLLARLVTEG